MAATGPTTKLGGGFLTRDQILNAQDSVTEEVEVPEWGGKVLVKGLTSEERDLYEKSILTRIGKGRKATTEVNYDNARAKLVALVIVDEAGHPLFTLADVAALGRKSSAALSRVADTAMRLSGLTDEDMDELEGNSGPPQQGASATS